MPPTSDTGATTRPPLRIGDWWVDPATNALSRAGRTVRIEPKAMEVLVQLADRAGHVASREALFAAVWPGVVVGDEALTQSVIKLRRALGDNPRSPSYIETISKRGYRLIAPVTRPDAVPASPFVPAPEAPVPATPPRGRKRAAPALLVAGLILGIGAIAFVAIQATAPRAPSEEAIDAVDEVQPAMLTLIVVPFESLGDGEQAYLARGIGNDLTTELSRLPGLRLISATSAPDRASARPGHVVTGSVQRSSETLRITIHLRDAQSGQQLWSERFERPLRDLFAVQDEIVGKLTALLPGKLSEAAREQRAKRYTRSLEAYDHLLRGQALFLVRQVDANEEARTLYRKALELDPNFARAYAGLAMTHAMDAVLQWRIDPSATLARAYELAETARLIDPDIPEVHWALGFVHVQSRRHDQALKSLQRAVELNRSYADAYAFMGGIHAYAGRAEEGIPLLRTALRLNQAGGHLYHLNLGRAYLFANDNEQALINLRESAARNPVNLETRIYLAAALAAAGDLEGGRWEVDEVRALEPAFSLPRWLESSPLTSTRYRERLLELLAKVDLR